MLFRSVASGNVTAQLGESNTRQLQRRSAIRQGETVITGDGSRVQLRFNDGAVVALDSNSKLVIENYRFEEPEGEDHAVVKLLTGGLRTLSGQIAEKEPENYRVETPLASIGVRGTHYQLVLEQDQLNIAVWTGRIVVSNSAGVLPLGRNANYRYAVVRGPGIAPEGRLKVPPAIKSSDDTLTPGLSTGEDGPESDSAVESNGEATSTTDDSTENATSDDTSTTEDSGSTTEDTTGEEDALETSTEEDLEEDSSNTESWLPNDINRKTLGTSAATVPFANNSDHLVSTNSTALNPAVEQYVAEAPSGQYISLEGTGLDRFTEGVGGYLINWGAWNGTPDLLLHDSEFDETGSPIEAFEQPLFLASAPALSLAHIQDLRGTDTVISFDSYVSAIGQVRDTELDNGFDTPFSDGSVNFGISGMDLDLGSGDVNGQIEVIRTIQSSNDAIWNATFAGSLGGDDLALGEITEITYNNGSDGENVIGESRGLIVQDPETGQLGFLNNFHFSANEDSATATGILLLEEPE